MFELAEDFVVDATFVAEAHGGFAFGVEEFLGEREVTIVKVARAVMGLAVLMADVGEAIGVVLMDVVVEIGGFWWFIGAVAVV